MASFSTTCITCGSEFTVYGNGTASIDALKGATHFDTDECRKAFAESERRREFAEAEAGFIAARERLTVIQNEGNRV